MLARFLMFVAKIVPKVGPFRPLAFEPLTPEAEKLLLDSLLASRNMYRTSLAGLRSGKLALADTDFDTGQPSEHSENPLAIETYAKLLEQLAKHKFAEVSPELRADLNRVLCRPEGRADAGSQGQEAAGEGDSPLGGTQHRDRGRSCRAGRRRQSIHAREWSGAMTRAGLVRWTLSAALLSAAATACVRVDAAPQSVQVEMSNVDLHVATDVTLHVRHLRGRFVPVARQMPYLDDTHSYLVAIDTGEISLDVTSLNALLARSLGGDGSNLDNLRVSFETDGTLAQRGVIDSKVNVPFSAKAVISTTTDGRIRVSPQSVRSLGIPVGPVMNLFGMKLNDLVRIAPGRGIVTDGDDLLLDPGRLISAPSVQGRMTAVPHRAQSAGPDVRVRRRSTDRQSPAFTQSHLLAWRAALLRQADHDGHRPRARRHGSRGPVRLFGERLGCTASWQATRRRYRTRA